MGKPITLLSRAEVEKGDVILESALSSKVGFLVPGDPLISTTHSALRLQASEKGIDTRIIHNASIQSAAPAISGLFNYKFGPSSSIPFQEKDYRPESFYDVMRENKERGLHTLLFLDIKEEDRLMTVNEALAILLEIESRRREGVINRKTIVVGLGRVGSGRTVFIAGSVEAVEKRDFGPTPHILIIPGRLHFMEEEYLKEFGGLIGL